MDPFAQALTASPEFLPHLYDPARDSVTFSRLSAADYERASFLDQRLTGLPSRTVPFAQLEAAAAALPEATDFIFHIGHVGSTLLARLLGQHPAILALREPAILRTLAQLRLEPGQDAARFEARLSTFLKLWSRTFAPGQRSLIKATSFASELASGILARPFAPRAIFMFARPDIYLATILGAENSPQEIRFLAASRLKRLQKRAPALIPPASLGETVAMSWACELAALKDAAGQAGDRVLWLDFDVFLADPKASLAGAFAHLRVPASDSQLNAIASSDDMRRYSKAPEFDYDAKLRGDVLAQARAEHGTEIRRGMAWLEKNGLMG